MSLSDWTERVTELVVERAAIDKQLAEEEANLKAITSEAAAIEESQKLVQHVAQWVQERVHQRISRVVSRCLRAVFGEDAYRFRIDFVQSRGKTEAKLLFERDGLEVDPLTASGGGPVDVAAFALRLAALVLATPRRRKVLLLDEPFRYVSKEYWANLQQMLLVVAEEMGVQFILVTHEDGLKVGKVVEIGR